MGEGRACYVGETAMAAVIARLVSGRHSAAQLGAGRRGGGHRCPLSFYSAPARFRDCAAGR